MKNEKITRIQKMLKIAMGVCAVALCVHFTTVGSYAYTQTTGTVIPATAKIRTEANTSSAVVGSTAAGKTVTITDEVSGSDGSTWYQIIVDGSTKGYIRADLVTKAASSTSSTDTASSTPSTTSTDKAAASVTQTDSQAATISTASANVRKSASTTGEVISSIPKGTSVTITGETTGDDGKKWYQITYSGASTGFVRADLVTAGAAAETEVTGTKSSDTDNSDKEEKAPAETSTGATTEEASTEEVSTEEVSTEAATEAATGEDSAGTTSSTGAITVMNTEDTPTLPSGFQEVSVTLNNENVRAWKNGDFYIFYGQAADGSEGFYMYDSVEASYQRYFMSNIEMPEEEDATGITGMLKPVVIAMAVVLVILLIIIIILTVKLNEYKEELNWDMDEDDDYPEDDIEEEEEEELPKPVKKKKRKVKPVIEEDEVIEEEEEPEPIIRRVPKKKIENTKPQTREMVTSKPRNFLEVEEEKAEIPVRKKVKKKPALKPVSDDLDPDDEDTFVFINLDGDDLD